MRTLFDILKCNRGSPEKKEEKKEEEVIDPALDEEIEETEKTEETEEVEIDLEEEEEEEEKKPDNKAFAEMRIENKELKKTVDEMKNQIDGLSQPAPVVAPVSPAIDAKDPRTWTEEQWDSLAKSDWKKAVDLRSSIQAEDKFKEQATSTEFTKVQEESKASVLTRHPELNDPNSEKSKIYRNIVTASPEYTVQKKGPLSAMYEMEDYMEKHMGYKREDIVKAEDKARQEESNRHSRAGLTSTPGRHAADESKKVTLTKDEIDFCELQGIDKKTYAINKKKLETTGKGGIQL